MLNILSTVEEETGGIRNGFLLKDTENAIDQVTKAEVL